ncbi:MAG: ferrous iron transport protein B, partial [Gemmataceae bacterium]
MTPTAALIGNPNTGKTTLFNALSGLNHRTGNYPGVTVESKKASADFAGTAFTVIDLPGTYSLAPRSPDEMVAVDVLLGRMAGEPRPDVLVCIVDASNLERNLYLTTQAMELGVPVVLALNMTDVAAGHGVTVDADKLAARLDVPVVSIQANQRKGLDALRAAVAAAVGKPAPTAHARFPEAFDAEAAALGEALGADVPPFLVRRLLLDVGGQTERRFGAGPALDAARQRLLAAGCPVPAVEARARYGWIREALKGVVTRPEKRLTTWTDRLDAVLTHRVWGTVVFLAVMFALFQSIFVGADVFMSAIDAGVGVVAEGVAGALPPGPLTSLLTEGVIGGVGSVVVFLPQILILFAFLAVLEDCGYMTRAAFLMDRLMARAGLSGKSFIPLLSSLACAIPGIMATRVIEDRRDRLATILVAPLMSCSARLPVYLLLIGAFFGGYPAWVRGLVMFGLYLIGIVAAPLVAWALKATLLRGPKPVFVMEMPPYQWPGLWVVGRRVYDAAAAFLYRAGTVILATSVVIWALLYFPAGTYPEQIAAEEDAVKDVRGAAKGLKEQIEAGQKAGADVGEKEEELARLEERLGPVDDAVNGLLKRWREGSYLGRFGMAVHPAFEPLGWRDWRVTVAALASVPAREVIVGTLGVLYGQGKVDAADEGARQKLGERLKAGDKGLTMAVALGLLVFF